MCAHGGRQDLLAKQTSQAASSSSSIPPECWSAVWRIHVVRSKTSLVSLITEETSRAASGSSCSSLSVRRARKRR